MFDLCARQAVSPRCPNHHIVNVAWNQRGSDHFQRFANARRQRGPSSPELTSELHHTKSTSEWHRAWVTDQAQGSVAFAAQPPDKREWQNKTVTQTVGTQTPTSTSRFRGSATAARHTVVTSIGAATAPDRASVTSSRSMTNIALAAVGYCATEDLQRLVQSRIDLVIQRSWMPKDEAAVAKQQRTFKPTDENLNLHGPPLAVPYFISPTPNYRSDTKPEPLQR